MPHSTEYFASPHYSFAGMELSGPDCTLLDYPIIRKRVIIGITDRLASGTVAPQKKP